MLNDCLEVIYPGDWIIGDNMNYHVSGWSYETIAPIFEEMEIHYKEKRIAKYFIK